jgi:cyclohexanecarboxyl-CoA dehydrogenase
MDFSFNPDQQLLRDTLADFARRELLPAYAERDKDEDLPRGIVRKLGEMGLLAPMVEQRYGGQGLDYVSLGIAFEELGRCDFNAAYVLLLAALVGAIIAARGDERQKSAYLPAICSGEVIPALGVTEPSGGSDAAHVKLTARREGDTYILDGEKTSISFASWADTIVVLARTGTMEQGAHGISAFYAHARSAAASYSLIPCAYRRMRGSAQKAPDSCR